MFKYIPIKNNPLKVIKKSEKAILQAQKNAADIDYIAMMTDIELNNESEVEEEDEAQ